MVTFSKLDEFSSVPGYMYLLTTEVGLENGIRNFHVSFFDDRRPEITRETKWNSTWR